MLGHRVERRNNKTVMKMWVSERSCLATEGNFAADIFLNGGRKSQRTAMGTKFKHRKSLVSVTKWPTKFQKVTNDTVLLALEQGTPHWNIQTRRNGKTKPGIIKLSRRKDNAMSVDEATGGRRCCIIKN